MTLCKSVPWVLHNKYANSNVSGETVSISLDDSGNMFRVPLEEFAAMMTNCSNATTSAAEMFWERHVLELSPGISEVGGLKWDLVLCLFISWVIVFLCLIRGVSSSGKVRRSARIIEFPFPSLRSIPVRNILQPMTLT